MQAALLAIGAMFAVSTIGLRAEAATSVFSFSGGPFSGSGVFTIVPNVSPPDPNPLCGTAGNNPCRADPPGAYAITNVTGTFSDSNLGITNAAITGLVPIHPANERDATFDPLVPTSLSFIDYPGPPAGALTYNNLFFPDGSPIDCAYPFSGTFLDVFGVAFTVAGGYTVDLWGDGAEPVIGLTYGVGVTNGQGLLDYQFDGVSGTASVPEPSTWALMLMGFGGLAWSLRRTRSRDRAYA
ncbi:MAG TPA: PEP-CTERM sorting domain-containing protein [Phenylobacterium sp.]|nr:PEP-CTERM sorting domain-containing protein [Phenylobacterium sp.]